MKEVCSEDYEVTGKRVVGRRKLGLKEENLKVQIKTLDFVLTSEAFDYLIFFFKGHQRLYMIVYGISEPRTAPDDLPSLRHMKW